MGYGTDQETGIDYYILRNSWGKDYGEGGYVRIFKDSTSLGRGCVLIRMEASYPVVVNV